MLKLSLNDEIKVKLTEHGKEIYYHRHDQLINDGFTNFKRTYPREDANGYTKFILWDFMRIYGRWINWDSDPVIEDNALWLKRDCFTSIGKLSPLL